MPGIERASSICRELEEMQKLHTDTVELEAEAEVVGS